MKKAKFEQQENPAFAAPAVAAFLSQPEPTAAQTKKRTPTTAKKPTKAPAAPEAPVAPEGYIIKPEPKTRRLQLLIAPSLYDQVKAAADAAGKSVNLQINEILAEAMKKQ